MKKTILIIMMLSLTEVSWSQQRSFADHWKFVGVAVSEPGYTIWGTSPIYGNDGKVHLFVARWPTELRVDPGWRSHSEIAHYIGESPEGPFVFSDVAIKGSGLDTWDKYGAHNPAVHKVGDTYVIVYIANDNPEKPHHGSNQRIGMVTSKSLHGPWNKVGRDGMILAPPSNEQYWNYKSRSGVNNPALLHHPEGGFFLYFKSNDAKSSKMGLAIAEELEGPYVQLPWTVTYNKESVEDGYAFMYKGKFCLLTTDNHGMITFGGGLLWSSNDGLKFTHVEKGYYTINEYLPAEKLANAVRHYGPEVMKFERPQILMKDGEPAYLYAPSGYSIFGGESTVSYVLKFEEYKIVVMRNRLLLFVALTLTSFAGEELPKVLIMGDSISIGYTPYVEKALEGRAIVVHNEGNAQHTGTGLIKLDEWLGNIEWKVLHFNWGLWDLCYRSEQSRVYGNRDKIHGTVTFTPEEYGNNLEQLVIRLKQTKAKLIFATTTYIPEGEAGRIFGDDQRYNKVAIEIMKKHNIQINDLNGISREIHKNHKTTEGDVHYTPEGYVLLAKPVTNKILENL